MIREQKSLTATRRDLPPSKRQENNNPSAYKNHVALSQDHKNTMGTSHAQFTSNPFGEYKDDDTTSESTEFLPSPSFDVLQSSIASASKNFTISHQRKEHLHPVHKNTGSKKSGEAPEMVMLEVQQNSTVSQRSSRSKSTRPSSNFRRPDSPVQQGISVAVMPKDLGSNETSTVSFASRNRRQSQHITTAASLNSTVKPRKSSNGTGAPELDLTKSLRRRRPSRNSNPKDQLDPVSLSSKMTDGAPINDATRSITATRVDRIRSLQPLSKNRQSNLPSSENSESHRVSLISTKPQCRPTEKVSSAPSRKRLSVIPGMLSQSHLTGLGARTISPTDARRAKRLSCLQGPLSSNTPPTPQSESGATKRYSKSPSMLPTKAYTPSSPRASPEVNRKSYSSGQSNTSANSYNASRESAISLQTRSSQLSFSSRLPTPKPRNSQNSLGNEQEDKEIVPPVPAIPKAYESPKSYTLDLPQYTKRKSSLPFESGLMSSASENPTGRASLRDLPKGFKEKNARRSRLPDFQSSSDFSPVLKKTLQPLRLPPFNLRPLSTATTIKFEASDGPAIEEEKKNRALKRLPATPSSPMTASKASFPRSKDTDEKSSKVKNQSRSNSAAHYIRPVPKANLPDPSKTKEQQPEPIITSSPPTASSALVQNEIPALPLHLKLTDDAKTSKKIEKQHLSQKFHSPRVLNLNIKANVRETPPVSISSSEEPQTPLSASLRRRISRGWKRNNSKSSISHAISERESEKSSKLPDHKNTSPPRLPTSSTVTNLSGGKVPSPSLSVKSTTYLDFKRRKSSVSSMSMFGGSGGYHDRTRSDSWDTKNAANKNTKPKADRLAQSVRTTSVMQKMLSHKSSNNSARVVDQWTVDLDRDDLIAEDEIKRLAMKRKDTESAARHLSALRKRAIAKESITPQEAIKHACLNIFERGEVMDYKEVYFCGTPDAAKHVGELSVNTVNFGYDDERGDYSIIPGDHLSYRYEIIDLLGKGSFGQVVRCIDHKTGVLVAVKIIRNKKRFHQQALVEVNILQKIREWDSNCEFSMVTFTQSFYFRGHLCISTELLDMNLYELIKSNSFRGFSLKIVRRFTKQILNSLLLLQKHKVIHCDLKPENVLLAHPLHSEIKVIDFGSSCFENEKVYTYIQSRFYRSPEVILGMTYGMPIDMWSLGCIMAELYSGVPIFPGENEQEQLAYIMEVFGPPDKHLIEKSTRRKLFFDSLGKPRLTVSSKGRRRRPSSKTLQQVLKCDDHIFLDFLSECLKWDPESRMKPNDAIQHLFITGPKAFPTANPTRINMSIKRHNTVAAATSNRPLPETPTTNSKNRITNRDQDISSSSKSNIVANSHGLRNQSLVNGSSLPRASRNTSGKIESPNSNFGNIIRE
ncbi:serine/threonine protein kinas/protein kinase [Blumeria hordei DH14]|uniref:dual-specificity kinase n=1 Tax=Blumeria graminis f. sp. hordei (strain DH14) TaxID=546991 RepID=N1J8H4_BLUG1|nr:serine/threonine protein kinas/protein kinase [Blumeria hordei DH14]